VLDQNLFRIPPARISDTRVFMTLLGGKVVYDAMAGTAPGAPSSPAGSGR
jgi:hypothetical protein